MRIVAVTAAVVLAGVLGLAGWGGSTEARDNATAADRSAAPEGTTGGPLANTDPCSLLKPSDVPELSHGSRTATPRAMLPSSQAR